MCHSHNLLDNKHYYSSKIMKFHDTKTYLNTSSILQMPINPVIYLFKFSSVDEWTPRIPQLTTGIHSKPNQFQKSQLQDLSLFVSVYWRKRDNEYVEHKKSNNKREREREAIVSAWPLNLPRLRTINRL